MNRLLVLLAAYLCVLATMPCADDLLVNQQQQAVQSLDNTADSHHQDECSIFCVCNCCGHFATVSPQAFFDFFLYTFPESDNNFLTRAPTAVGRAIWQPPKFS